MSNDWDRLSRQDRVATVAVILAGAAFPVAIVLLNLLYRP
jgi:hypothetical protein